MTTVRDNLRSNAVYSVTDTLPPPPATQALPDLVSGSPFRRTLTALNALVIPAVLLVRPAPPTNVSADGENGNWERAIARFIGSTVVTPNGFQGPGAVLVPFDGMIDSRPTRCELGVRFGESVAEDTVAVEDVYGVGLATHHVATGQRTMLTFERLGRISHTCGAVTVGGDGATNPIAMTFRPAKACSVEPTGRVAALTGGEDLRAWPSSGTALNASCNVPDIGHFVGLLRVLACTSGVAVGEFDGVFPVHRKWK